MRLDSIIPVAYHIKINRFRENKLFPRFTQLATPTEFSSLQLHLTIEILVMSEEWSRQIEMDESCHDLGNTPFKKSEVITQLQTKGQIRIWYTSEYS